MSHLAYPNGHKRAQHGEPELFLRSLLGAPAGDECVDWPYAFRTGGYGLATIGGKQLSASRWICILAHGWPPFSQAEAAHSCGNRRCVNPRHLRWDTKRGNQADRLAHRTTNHGERNGKSRLTKVDVEAIRTHQGPRREIAARFGVSVGCITKIRNGTRWRSFA